ncbi:histidine kinase dimerization/phospho-acceptor domain-containing protein [Streptomyces sp. NPDC101237]|uniref:histidine kinase dimerization/phospho-acceptor domain-containing protein n=1 Tax=Streptomyces sp. NPDC101237 TaxID=3366139 RepID=UPI0038111A22
MTGELLSPASVHGRRGYRFRTAPSPLTSAGPPLQGTCGPADVSHELRTPLTAMAALTDVLDENAPHHDREPGDALRSVSGGTTRPSGLVEDLYRSRLRSAAATVPPHSLSLAAPRRRRRRRALTASPRCRNRLEWAGGADNEHPTGLH